MITIANLSGGRDSTAMVVKWLELGRELHYIIFCDTGHEFGEMYGYINKLDSYLQEKFNKKITRLDNSKEIEKWAFEYPIQSGKNKGRLRGLPKAIGRDYCTRESKINPTRAFAKSLGNIYRIRALIGYTYNEVEGGRNSTLDYAVAEYPLHEWKWNEAEVTEFLKARGIMNPLYNDFARTGCYFCPKQSLRSLYALFSKYPKEWEKMKEWELKAKELNCCTQSWRADNKSLLDYERIFKEKEDPLLFEDNFLEQETCFCK